MSHHPLIARNAGAVTISARPRCLLPCDCLGLRFWRYPCSPWLVLAIAPIQWLLVSERERIRLQIRCFSAIARIDFVRVYELLNDCLW